MDENGEVREIDSGDYFKSGKMVKTLRIIEEFIGLKPKMYSFINYEDTSALEPGIRVEGRYQGEDLHPGNIFVRLKSNIDSICYDQP